MVVGSFFGMKWRLFLLAAIAICSAGLADAKDPLLANVKIFDAVYDNSYSILRISMKLKNDNDVPVKDIPVVCILYAESGTTLGGKEFYIYRIIPAHGDIKIEELNVGPIPQQVTRGECIVNSSGVPLKYSIN